MGHHTRHIDEDILRLIYERDSINGIFLLFHTADAIVTSDKFSSEITDFFRHNYTKTEIMQKINDKFLNVN